MGSGGDLHRLESKIDKLTDAVMHLVLMEERLITLVERVGAVEMHLFTHQGSLLGLERPVDKWISRGLGAWGLAVTLFAVLALGEEVWSPH